MESIESVWNRIAAWHETNTSGGTFTLAEGASETEIAALEAEVGVRLPEDLRASFALHNGAANEEFLLYHGELLSLEGVLKFWRMYGAWQRDESWGAGEDYRADAVEGPIKAIWWNPQRLPLTDNSGDAVMMDFDAPTEGTHGQIIEFSHEVGPHRVLAKNWLQFLTEIADGLDSGKYVYDEDEETVAPPGMWD